MNIIFLTLVNIKNFSEQHNIYSDLCRNLVKNGHQVDIVCPEECGRNSSFSPYQSGSNILKVKTGRIQKTSLIRKGISTLLVAPRFKSAIKKFLRGKKYDLILYSTPPITLYRIVQYIKTRDSAKTYLLLKDIFPQNAVDLGIMKKKGPKSFVYKCFRYMEKKLYAVSDYIGCMSSANMRYLLEHNPQIPAERVHVNPNSFDPIITKLARQEKKEIRRSYGIPEDKTVFIYGGNLGKPQDIPFIIKCLKSVASKENCFFVVCGDGTGYALLESYSKISQQKNFLLIHGLPRNEYEKFVGSCDVGLIFLDYRFTIPNFPSRILSYMQKSMPVLACTDRTTDLKNVIERGNFGFWCPSNNAAYFAETVDKVCESSIEDLGQNAACFLQEHYSVDRNVRTIMKNLEG